MVNNKKELERQELHKAIWAIANKLRGAVDGWDFKMYVLGFIYYRFISEKFENYVNENQKSVGIKDFKYSEDSDENALKIKNAMIKRVGYFILPSELFSNVAKKAEKDENLNETLEKIFSNIEASAKGTKSENLFKTRVRDVSWQVEVLETPRLEEVRMWFNF